VPDESDGIEISPNLLDQEVITKDTNSISYWKGSVSVKVTVSGKAVSGKGYVEITGYAGPFGFLKSEW
jgi:predicted secreted hydrolase